MALGTYILGASAKIPMQVMINNLPVTDATPIIKKMILPDGTEDSSFPQEMTAIDDESGIYFYEYIPEVIGDYIVTISTTINSVEYISNEHFIVAPRNPYVTGFAPRIEAK